MSEREKLIKLIDDFGDDVALCDVCSRPREDCEGCTNEQLAEYLLESGVIVPPVKVGDTVYGISRGAIIPIDVDRIVYSKRGIDIVGRNEMCFGYGTITLHPDNEFGLEWYTTKKEAEKALKGGVE